LSYNLFFQPPIAPIRALPQTKNTFACLAVSQVERDLKVLQILTPMTDAPWYVLADGPLNAHTLPHILAVIQTAGEGSSLCPGLDLTAVTEVDPAAAAELASWVERGKLNLLMSPAVAAAIPAHLSLAVRESHLAALESIATYVQDRLHQGLTGKGVLEELFERLRPVMA
jgi:ABC-type transporter Mla MlaB component